MPHSIPDEIAARVRRLPMRQQERALAFVRGLEAASGPAPDGPESLARFAGTIARADLTAMATAITAECERVDAGAW